MIKFCHQYGEGKLSVSSPVDFQLYNWIFLPTEPECLLVSQAIFFLHRQLAIFPQTARIFFVESIVCVDPSVD